MARMTYDIDNRDSGTTWLQLETGTDHVEVDPWDLVDNLIGNTGLRPELINMLQEQVNDIRTMTDLLVDLAIDGESVRATEDQ